MHNSQFRQCHTTIQSFLTKRSSLASFDGFYILAYGEIIDGESAEAEREREEEEKKKIIEERKAEGIDFEFLNEYPTGEQRMMTSRVDMKSATRSPQWLDENVAVS